MAEGIKERVAAKKTADSPNAEQVAPDSKTQPAASDQPSADKKKEIGGPNGPEPTRYGDWEKGGRCIDF